MQVPNRRAAMDAGLRELGADPESMAFQGGKLVSEVAGTLGVGGGLANMLGRSATLARTMPNAREAIRSAGMTAGPVGAFRGAAAGNMALRTAGGAITGGASAGLVDPENAATGAAFGGALPGAVKVAGTVGSKIGRSIAPRVSEEVSALAARAKELGIPIPADRITNSKPLNAVASSLSYVPFSGRAATEEAMQTGLERAVSRTFGQDTPNVTKALKDASKTLGAQFDDVLQNNSVKITEKFVSALQTTKAQAENELAPDAASIINKQIAVLLDKGRGGVIDGQAAYNVKKTLDRIGSRSTNEAFYARELKRALMDALNDSLGQQGASSFSKLRQQYGNMLTVENLAQNGAEGGVSAARLGNLRNINNADLQELADIASQFLRTRESPHASRHNRPSTSTRYWSIRVQRFRSNTTFLPDTKSSNVIRRTRSGNSARGLPS
jgi:hypothetical protein